jgi:hypothetical protein
MLPHRVPRPGDDKTARAHLRANVQAAAVASPDPGHWHSHHIALPGGMSGDFTPHRAPDYAEEEHAVHQPLLEWLAELVGIDHAAGTARRGAEAGREAGS